MVPLPPRLTHRGPTWFLSYGNTITCCLQLLAPPGLPMDPSWTANCHSALQALQKCKTAFPSQMARVIGQEGIICLMWCL